MKLFGMFRAFGQWLRAKCSWMFADLNLNGDTPVRAQPRLGEWGPVNVPLRSGKARMRVWASLALLAGLTLIVVMFIVLHQAIMNS